MQLTVCVSGATGFVGKAVCKSLAENGVKVIALVRKESKSHVFSHKNVEAKTVDIFDANDLFKAIIGVNVFFHFIGSSRKTTNATYEKINEDSTRVALEACRIAGVKKFVYISGLGVSPKNNQHYFRSKRNAEDIIKSSGIDYVIFRPSYITGKDSPFVHTIVKQAKSSGVVVPGSGNYRLQPIDVTDFGQICASLSTDNWVSTKVFDLVGPKVLTFNAYMRLVCKTAKVKPKLKKIPLEKCIQMAMSSLSPPYTVGELVVLVSDTFSSSKPLEKAFGFKLKQPEKTLSEVFSR